MTLFQSVLMVAAFLCSLVAGFLFAFAVVVMPGLRSLSDADFIRAFQVIDRVIQKNQPIFIVVWVGSVVALVAAAVLGIRAVYGVERVLLFGAPLVYLLGVQVPTVVINIPLNNRLQTLDAATMSESARMRARRAFEPRWNRWNAARATFASVATVLLIVLLLRV